MGTLGDTSRFLELCLLASALYLGYGYVAGHDVDVLALVLFLTGGLAIVLVAHRFSEDFASDAES